MLFFHLRSRTGKIDQSEARVEIMIHGKRRSLSNAPADTENKMTVMAQTPTGDVGLIVELPSAPAYLPLVDPLAGTKYDEVIITRFDDAGLFRKDKVYLLISDRSVSRPDGLRNGHAAVFLDPKSGRYQIRDLGSVGGTQLDNIRLNGAAYLENGDAITVGTVSLKYYDMRSART
jgi:hypothetical protein